MTNNILFLDIDGVLNDLERHLSGFYGIKGHCVTQLLRVVHAVKPRIVISSSWRYFVLSGQMTLDGFRHMLATHDVPFEIYGRIEGVTAADEAVPTRGGQIAEYVEHDPFLLCGGYERPNFVVLDDCPPCFDFKPVESRVVKTDGRVGLTKADADVVIQMFQKGTA